MIILSIVLTSCQYIDRKVPSGDELLDKELQAINWNEVDAWPSISNCDSILNEDEKKNCFLNFLSEEIRTRIESDTIKVAYSTIDTVEVRVVIMPDSTVQFQSKFTDKDSETRDLLDSVLTQRFTDFPKVNPAIKRGVPVKTQFELPIVLNVEKQKTKKRRRR